MLLVIAYQYTPGAKQYDYKMQTAAKMERLVSGERERGQPLQLLLCKCVRELLCLSLQSAGERWRTHPREGGKRGPHLPVNLPQSPSFDIIYNR